MGISKGVDAFNLPSVPAPFSYQAWANGEPSDSAGPPSIYHAVTQILYARFFYNSSTPERQASFEQQCASVRAPICSTDDMTLRNSTAFSLVALDDYVEPHIPFKVPMYGIIAFSVAMGLLLILAFHTLVTRAVNVASRKRFAKAQLRESANSTPAPSGYLLDSNGKAGSTRANSEKDSWHKKQGSDGYAETNMEEILVARSASYIHGYAGSRNGDEASSVDHGSTLYHSRSAMFPTRSARESMSSRPASIASRKRRGSSTHAVRRANRQMPEDPSRDITDLDQLFDGWETDSDHDDEDEFANAEPISGNYERYDDWMNPEGLVEGDSGNSSPHLPHLPRHSSDADIMATHQLHKNGSPEYPSSPSSHKIEQEPASQIVRWHIREPETGATDAVGRLAEPTDEVDARAIKRDLNAKSAMGNYPSIFTVVLRKIDNFFFVARTTVVTSTGQRRIDYLDGMRGYACLFVSNGHFLLIFYPGIANQFAPHHHPGFEYWYRCTIAAITINPSLLLGTFFALPARTMCQRYLLKGGLGGMADATVRRIPRLMVPVIGAAVMNYFLMDNNAFKWVQRLNSRTWSIWSYWQNYDNVMVFVDAVITLPFGGPPEAPALVTGYATGVLWTIPVIIQGMWTCMIATVIAHEIKNHWKRFGFYFVIILFSWYANTWDMYFVSGLIVGDLDSKLRYREWAARGIPLPFKLPGKDKFIRVHGRYLAWLFLAACCVQQWLGFIPNAPGNDFAFKEFAIHPNWKTSSPHVWEGQSGYQGYTNPAVVGWFLIMGIFMVADLTPSFQKFFRLRIWHFLGIHSMSIYLLHGIIWWTWAAWLVLKLLERGVVYWAAVLCAWITGYIVSRSEFHEIFREFETDLFYPFLSQLLIMFCIVFTNTFEVWATSFAKAWWRWVSGNLGRKE